MRPAPEVFTSVLLLIKSNWEIWGKRGQTMTICSLTCQICRCLVLNYRSPEGKVKHFTFRGSKLFFSVYDLRSVGKIRKIFSCPSGLPYPPDQSATLICSRRVHNVHDYLGFTLQNKIFMIFSEWICHWFSINLEVSRYWLNFQFWVNCSFNSRTSTVHVTRRRGRLRPRTLITIIRSSDENSIKHLRHRQIKMNTLIWVQFFLLT